MIIEEPGGVERYIFVFDLNDATPINPAKYRSWMFPDTPTLDALLQKQWKLSGKTEAIIDPKVVERFRAIDEWLSKMTSAYRLVCTTLDNPEYNSITVVAAQVPASIAPIFRLFWY